MSVCKFIDWRLMIPVGAAIIVVIFFGNGLTNVLANVSFSIIAAFIFYLVIDVARRVREANILSPLVTRQIRQLKGDVMSVCREAARIAGTPLEENWQFNLKDIEPAFKNTGLFVDAAMVDPTGKKQSFLNFVLYHAQRSENLLKNLIQISPFLGSEATAHVTEMQTDGYLMQLKLIPFSHLRKDHDAGFLAGDIAKHYDAILKLEDWARRNGILSD